VNGDTGVVVPVPDCRPCFVEKRKNEKLEKNVKRVEK